MTLFEFRRTVSYSLLLGTVPEELGVSTVADVSAQTETETESIDESIGSKKRKQSEVPPEIKFNHHGHLPEYKTYKLHCRICHQKTFWACMRCNNHLCIVKERRCFYNFHTHGSE